MTETKCGLIALVGAPNVGKSTLMNALVGEKVGIVSPKPNTTRLVVRGIVNEGEKQFIFVDTPGLREGTKGLDRALVQQARGALEDADIVCYLMDATKNIGVGLEKSVKEFKGKKILVLTKVDLVKPKAKLLPILQQVSEWGMDEVVPVSARQAKTVDGLRQVIGGLLPVGPWLFPGGLVAGSDMALPIRLAELTREQAMLRLREEVPYGVAVVPGEIVDDEGEPLVVNQTILVEREGHKGIVIGNGGAMLGEIGRAARLAMQKLLGRGVRLELTVKVDAGWREKAEVLKGMGLAE